MKMRQVSPEESRAAWLNMLLIVPIGLINWLGTWDPVEQRPLLNLCLAILNIPILALFLWRAWAIAKKHRRHPIS